MDAIVALGKTEWRVITKELPLYITNTRDAEIFRNQGAFLYYDLDKEQELIDMEPLLLNEVTVF